MNVADHQDVTRCVDLTDPQAVSAEVCALVARADARADIALIEWAFDVITRLYSGALPGYHGCETLYHDMQHTFDVTLACARLLAGHERLHHNGHRLGAERLTLGIIVALFHDAGYIRSRYDRRCWHGAQYTLHHVARGGRLLSRLLREQGHGSLARRAVKLIHFTGYEIPLEKIRLSDPLDRKLGHIVGTADLIAQMADRTYLEKCRDYLYQEFELGGMTQKRNPDGSVDVVYTSGFDLLTKTPAFYAKMVRTRLDEKFGCSYRFVEALYEGKNPYLEAIDRNMAYLQQALNDGRLGDMLRRRAEPVLGPARK